MITLSKPNASDSRYRRAFGGDLPVAVIAPSPDSCTRNVSWPLDDKMLSRRARTRVRLHLGRSSVGDGAAVGGRRPTELAELCSYLEQHDHSDLRLRLVQVSGVVATAVATYCDSLPYVIDVHDIFRGLHKRLQTHMFREEHGLYSSIAHLEQNDSRPVCPSDRVLRAIRAVKRDHRYFLSTFRRIAELLNGYDVPGNSGKQYVNLVRGLRDLESAKLEHMAKENFVYARAVALQRIARRQLINASSKRILA